MQAIGPKQRIFIDALRSGKYNKTVGELGSGFHCCVLGVANEACKLNEFSPSNLLNTFGDIGLYDRWGSNSNFTDNLTIYNDTRGATFEQIANMIEADPGMWFKEVK